MVFWWSQRRFRGYTYSHTYWGIHGHFFHCNCEYITNLILTWSGHDWVSLMIFSADLPYGKKLFVKESFVELIFGIPHPKTLQNIFLRHLCIFYLLLLKTARFYKSEISFIWGWKSQKKLFNKIEEGYLFCNDLLNDLQEKITIIDRDYKNSFDKTTYLGYWIPEINSAKISFANNFFV